MLLKAHFHPDTAGRGAFDAFDAWSKLSKDEMLELQAMIVGPSSDSDPDLLAAHLSEEMAPNGETGVVIEFDDYRDFMCHVGILDLETVTEQDLDHVRDGGRVPLGTPLEIADHFGFDAEVAILPKQDWRQDVLDGSTLKGYHEWVQDHAMQASERILDALAAPPAAPAATPRP